MRITIYYKKLVLIYNMNVVILFFFFFFYYTTCFFYSNFVQFKVSFGVHFYKHNLRNFHINYVLIKIYRNTECIFILSNFTAVNERMVGFLKTIFCCIKYLQKIPPNGNYQSWEPIPHKNKTRYF